ncbi:serine/threonine-protein kinase PknD [Mycolicibacter sinensis]|uniref:non-specific serine/threonine protein kinase n=1 Tax=Mycolicibacter sinensis (strain JDM601) TaxID=875328 RepID=A0A1A2Y0V9_MYCSD|nr:serine/threonine-protein kinase PknD [Mycolicibacter sinensis]OBH15540.1 serine/threonine protein kinase [Mycolicibacter sinensis]OBI30957.1 serine/threonine protein kinase [Mycolicibacter sinensis]
MYNGGPGSRAGSHFGHYRLIRLLGSGGMGEVYEAEDTRKHRMVALKLISPQLSDDPVLHARLRREADTAGRLTEPHVVPIHDYGEIDGQFYVEMRLIEGDSLRTLLNRQGPLSPARAVALIRQVAAALDAAHAAQIMHRDVKPENILVTGDDFVYLVDFGIARAATDPGLTQIGTAVGTYNYMAPERFTGGDVTYRADIYSLACVLGECLTGTPPYRADSIERMIAAHLTEPAPRPSAQRPGSVPPAFDQVIARGMAKRPEDRYRSAGELAAAAHDALTGPQQDQAATIIRHSEEAAFGPAPAAPVAPVAPAAQVTGWRDRPAPQPPTVRRPAAYAPPPASSRLGRRRGGPGGQRPAVLVAAILALVTVVGVVGYLIARPSHPSAAAPAGQSELQFTGINFRLSPSGVALDSDGNVYVASQGMYGRVVKLAAGSTAPTVLPFSGLYQPQGVAVDNNGTVYVSDFNNRVVKLSAGSNDQVVLPFNGLSYPEGLAVDSGGNVYVADRGNDRVVELASGSNTQTVLPFSGLNNPDGVAVDGSGTVYVTDTDNNRVLKLAAGSTDQVVLPFPGLAVPWGITVDSGANVYVTEHDGNKVLKLPAGATEPTTLAFTGLNTPLDVAVSKDNTVYVADRGNNRVVRLAPG